MALYNTYRNRRKRTCSSKKNHNTQKSIVYRYIHTYIHIYTQNIYDNFLLRLVHIHNNLDVLRHHTHPHEHKNINQVTKTSTV